MTKITIMGSASSVGTPAAGGFWGSCDPTEPKNTRTRASILVQTPATTLVVDASYDLRAHLNAYKIQKLDALLVSHSHNDHVNGIDDLRVISYAMEKHMPCYASPETHAELRRRWPYIYDGGSEGVYKPFIERHDILTDLFQIGDIEVVPFVQDHGTIDSLGFRFGNLAYSIDVFNLDQRAFDALKGVETWIVDAASYHNEHMMAHANLKRVLGWVDILKPKMTYLTCLTTRMDYQTLLKELPPNVRPAYDGLVIE